MYLTLFNLAPDTLAVVRQTELRAYYSIRTGIIWNGDLSIQTDGTTLKIQGVKDGTIPGEVGTGSYYTALYPNFFTSTTAPTVTASATAEQTQTGSWAASGNLTTARSGHTATLLTSGEVLVVSDSTAELFNPYSNTSRVSNGSLLSRTQHTATRLSSGQVLVAGGWSGLEPLYWRRTAELYDPATDTFTVADAMSTPRGNHTATLLDSGKVLVTGGNTTTGDTDTAELYDPATNTWSSAGSVGARAFHTATLLYSGQVLVTGGRTSSGAVLTDARLYDPATNTWTSMPSMGRARSGHIAIRLYSGTVMLVGGGYDEVDMYDPYNNRWYWNTLLGNGRNAVSATLLYSGEVLVTFSNGLAAIYSPSTESWRYAGSLSAPLTGHAATLLDSGNVLVTGGSAGSTVVSTVQRYTR
ncbi:Kelch repeat-containing protein [Archangium lansingense]|uniref:Kelch repeat-containing protein n=1 Tax=Archangium lansingense TaxID=2995310 RepID=UPI003B7D503E